MVYLLYDIHYIYIYISYYILLCYIILYCIIKHIYNKIHVIHINIYICIEPDSKSDFFPITMGDWKRLPIFEC